MTYAWDPPPPVSQSGGDSFGQMAVKGVIVLLHGYGAHSQYQWMNAKNPGEVHTIYEGTTVESMVKLGYAVRTLDHQSMGRSEGLDGHRCYFNKFDDLCEEALIYIKQYVLKEEQLAGLPVFLFGISMGGGTCIRLAEEEPNLFAGK